MSRCNRQVPVLQRHYNGNEYTREGRNGRLYSGVIGWRWILYLHGKPAGDPLGYKTKREAYLDAHRILCQAKPE